MAMFQFSKSEPPDGKLDFEKEILPFVADLYRVARWMTRSRDQAEDLVHDTVLEGMKYFHTY